MIVYDMATKALDIKSFPQHNIAGVISGNTFIVLFSQEKPLWWKEINTHTHTHTHTHTDIYIYTHEQHVSDNDKDVQVYFQWFLRG